MPSAADHPALTAAGRLRRLAELLADADDADAQWAASALKRYLAAPDQIELDQAFGLSGGRPWWRIERYEARDALLREVAQGLAGKTHAKATTLQQSLRRYGASAWLRDRVHKQPTAANALLFQVFTLDHSPPTGIRQLTEIIGG
jgi:hypothetical protein